MSKMTDMPCSSYTEERDIVSISISLYRDYPELWKVKSNDYLNKNKRSLAMERIVKVFEMYRPDFEVIILTVLILSITDSK